MKHILRCPQCGDYGLTPSCECGETRVTVRPAKYSPEDKQAKYRQQARLKTL
jgi:rRNA maturation protein Nop10